MNKYPLRQGESRSIEMASKRLDVLILDDEPDAASLIERGLQPAGFTVDSLRVVSADAMARALEERHWDVIAYGHEMGSFSSTAALKTLEESGLDIPFIVFAKNDMGRLAPAIERGIREAAWRQEKVREIERLSESERAFRSLFELGTAGIMQADANSTRLLQVNARFCEMLGFSREELLSMKFVDFVHPDERETKLQEFRDMCAGRISGWETERRFIRKDGETIWTIGCVSAVRDRRGHPTQAIGMYFDVTNQKDLEQRLRQAIEARDRFLSIASHELKTPLTSLKLQIQIFLRQLQRGDESYRTRERLEEMLATDAKQVLILTRLVDDMLDVSRIRTGKLAFHFDRSNLCSIVHHAAERMQEQVEVSGSKLTLETCEEIIGYWDEHRLSQVVINLLSNAARYGNGQPIFISTSIEGGNAVIRVRDQGRGIAQEDQARIFGQFERLVPESEVSGLGLGLFIVKKIVDAHHGRIELESEPGRGSEFKVILPIRTSAPERETQDARSDHASGRAR